MVAIALKFFFLNNIVMCCLHFFYGDSLTYNNYIKIQYKNAGNIYNLNLNHPTSFIPVF